MLSEIHEQITNTSYLKRIRKVDQSVVKSCLFREGPKTSLRPTSFCDDVHVSGTPNSC